MHLGDCLEILPGLLGEVAVLVTDPPYGIAYKSGRRGSLPRSVRGDDDTSARDEVLAIWGARPALAFGAWRIPRPAETRTVLIWDKGPALGMGALDLPWKPSHEEIYVLGRGFVGKRDEGSVLAVSPVQSMAKNGRVHPTQKPLELMIRLLSKCPPGPVLDPFAGSGTTGVAALQLGRRFIGAEVDPQHFETACDRLRAEEEGSTLVARRAGQVSLFGGTK